MPDAMPHASDTATVNASTPGSSRASARRGTSAGASATSSGKPQTAAATRRLHPRRDGDALQEDGRDDPPPAGAERGRIAISRRRPSARARASPVTFAQPIARTPPTAASSNQSAGPMAPAVRARQRRRWRPRRPGWPRRRHGVAGSRARGRPPRRAGSPRAGSAHDPEHVAAAAGPVRPVEGGRERRSPAGPTGSSPLRSSSATSETGAGGATPTTVNASPPSTTGLPTIDGSDPNRVRHSACPRTMLRGPPGRSSSSVKSRPSTGATPSTRK
jgi:hypothetical protein